MEVFPAFRVLCEGNSSLTDGFSSQRPVTRSYDVYFELRQNERLCKKSRHRWFETLLCSSWCHCNVNWLTWKAVSICCDPLKWRHNEHDGVFNHQPYDCLLNRLFRRRSKRTSKLRVTGLCAGKLPGPVNSPHKGPATRKMFPFDDVIMISITGLQQLSPTKCTCPETQWLDCDMVSTWAMLYMGTAIG